MLKRSWIPAIVAVIACSIPAQAQPILYGISNGFGIPADNTIYQIDPANANVSNIIQVTFPGFTVNNATAMAAQPGTGTLFAVLASQYDADPKALVTIDPNTGIATNIGLLGDAFSSLAFRDNGTLYGVTGDGAMTPETLFTINTANAVTTFAFGLGNGLDGETIAFHPNSFLYHSSGNGTALFESVNVDTQAVTPIGSAVGEMFAMGYSTPLGQLLGSDIDNNLFSINIANGARTLIGSLATPSDNRGLAFVTPVPEPTSMVLMGTVPVVLALRSRKLRRQTKS